MNLQKRLDSNVQSFQRVQAIASVGNMLRAKLSVGMALTLTFTINTLPINAAQSQQTENFRTFAEWCKNQASLSEAARQTVALLLEKAETTECDRASLNLSNLTELDLSEKQISDIQPLSGLTNLTILNLWENPIANRTCPSNLEMVCTF